MTEKPYKAAQIGCGSMGHGWVDAAIKTADKFKLPLTTRHNIKSLAMVFAAIESAKTSKKIPVQ